jgi:hypothetical protein
MTIRGRRVRLFAVPVAAILLTHTEQAGVAARVAGDTLAILWSQPGRIDAKDLYWGMGSEAEAPKPPFTFIKEDTGGSKPKVHVTDRRGMTWNVKFTGNDAHDNEVHAEVAASRLLWALGYAVEESYFVAEGAIEALGPLTRASTMIDAGGRFRTARFEKRPPEIVRTRKTWSFRDNPFLGSRELSGLKILMALLNSWDTKSGNNTILDVRTPEGRIETWYVVADLGSTFGRMDHPGLMSRSRFSLVPLFSRRNRWNLKDYAGQAFLDGVRDGELRLRYKGDVPMSRVPLEHARWLAGLASQLTEDQVRQAFEAAGASSAEIEGFTASVMERIGGLDRAVAAAAAH